MATPLLRCLEPPTPPSPVPPPHRFAYILRQTAAGDHLRVAVLLLYHPEQGPTVVVEPGVPRRVGADAGGAANLVLRERDPKLLDPPHHGLHGILGGLQRRGKVRFFLDPAE